MANVEVTDCQVWLERTKADLSGVLDTQLEDSIATIVLGRIAQAFSTSAWISPSTTPKLVKKIIAMHYAAAFYDRQYSEDAEGNEYAQRLREMANTLIEGIITGIVQLVDEPTQVSPTESSILFYPDDTSSALDPTPDDRSLGPEVFSMGAIW